MAIEIIRKGTKEKRTCKECGCYFSYEQEDIENQNMKYSDGAFRPLSDYTRKIIRCPQCETVIILEGTK